MAVCICRAKQSANFIENSLGLVFNPYTTQIEPHGLSVFLSIWVWVQCMCVIQCDEVNDLKSLSLPNADFIAELFDSVTRFNNGHTVGWLVG